MSVRRAFHLTEVLVAIAVVAGPLLIAITLVQRNTAGARFNEERAVARLVLLDLSEMLSGEPVARLRELEADPKLLAATFTERIGRLPAQVRDEYSARVKPLLGKLRLSVESPASPELPELARLTLHVTLAGPTKVEIRRLHRPAALAYPRGIPELSRP